jgi:hypothetical protein
MRFLGGKWQKKNKGRSKANKISRFSRRIDRQNGNSNCNSNSRSPAGMTTGKARAIAAATADPLRVSLKPSSERQGLRLLLVFGMPERARLPLVNRYWSIFE